MKKGTKLYAVVKQKCPRCQEGDLFEFKNSYRFKDITTMYKMCRHCDLKYEVEPGFFYGAMYISYGLTVALWAILAVSIFTFYKMSPWLFLGIGIALLLLLMPLIYRLSRAIWLNMFVAYNPEKAITNQNKSIPE
jgi:uncharacterized protein (DUF983 family)